MSEVSGGSVPDVSETTVRQYLARCQSPEYLGSAPPDAASRVGVAFMHIEAAQFEHVAGPLDAALQSAINVPATWLARAYFLAMAPRFEDGPEANIRVALDRARALAPGALDMQGHRVVVYGCLLSSMAIMIRKALSEAEEARARQKTARHAAGMALAAGVVGGLMGNSARSGFGQFLGYGVAGAGVATAISQAGAAGDFARIAKSAYGMSAAVAVLSMSAMDESERLLDGAPADAIAFVRRTRRELRDAQAAVLAAEARLVVEFATKFSGFAPKPWNDPAEFKTNGSWCPELDEAAFVARALRAEITVPGRMLVALSNEFEAALPLFDRAMQLEREGKSFRSAMEFASRRSDVVTRVKPLCRDFVAACATVSASGKDLDAGLPPPPVGLPPLPAPVTVPVAAPMAPAMPTAVVAPAPVATLDVRARLAELKALRDDEIITPEEYEAKRAEILRCL